MSDAYDRPVRVAVPSEAPGGLEAARSGHFGRTPCFTLVDILDDAIGGVMVVENESRGRRGSLSPVLVLSAHLVDAVIVAGIGHRSLLGCVQAGIRVFAGEDRPDVRSAVQAFLGAELSPVGQDATLRH